MPAQFEHHPAREGVFITLDEIFKSIQTVVLQHVELNAKLDTFIRTNSIYTESHQKDLSDLRSRVNELEKRPYLNPRTLATVISIVIAATAAVTAIVSAVTR